MKSDKLIHVANQINGGGHVQHRLMLGKKEIMSCLHGKGTPEEVLAEQLMIRCILEYDENEQKPGKPVKAF
jgi:hypothetical protein